MTLSMTHRRAWLAGLAIATALTVPEMASALPLEGSGELQIVSQTPVATGVRLELDATGSATRLGAFTRVEELILDPISNRFAGTVTFTAAKGDTLSGAVSGAFVGPATATGSYEWTSGTGRFEHPTGSALFVVTTSDGVHFAVQFRGDVSVVSANP